MRRTKPYLLTIALVVAAAAGVAKAPDSWDGLVRVKSKNVGAAYLLPNADFRAYSKVMIDPPQVAFRKNWQRDFNTSTRTLSGRISDQDVREAIDGAQVSLARIFAENFSREGYQVATQAGPDVLHLSIAVVNLTVNAPDRATSARQHSFSFDAGEATLVIEARDSLTGELLGRAADRRTTGEGPSYRRTYSSNQADFEALFENWARISARGMTELRASSPVDTEGLRKRR